MATRSKLTWGLGSTLVAIAIATTAHAGVTGYYASPALLDDAVVFVSDGDLWRAPLEGGTATRLTTVAGDEGPVRTSPDGRWIAFSAHYDGNRDVYVMPSAGGEPQRLTYHPGRDDVVAWRPDSSAVVFRSSRHTPMRKQFLYEIPFDGGQPTQVPVGIAASITFSPDGRHVAFNRWDYEFVDWKRYRGGTAEEIWIGDLETNQFHQLTEWDGTDRFPMWWQNRVYFLSDRDGRRNIYSVAAAATGENDLVQHTFHEQFDVRRPDLRDGRIVYMLGGDLRLLDLRSGDDREIAIALPTDRLERRPRFQSAAAPFDSFALSHDGSRVLVSGRGELWSAPAKDGRAVHITGGTSGVRERLPAFSPDGTRLACITDVSGEQEVAIFDADAPGPGEPLTAEGQGWLFQPRWSPTGTHIAYGDMTLRLRLVDVESGATKTIARSDTAEITEYSFSPDGKWIAWVDREMSWESGGDIFLYHLETDTTHRLTTAHSRDFSPTWDPQGRYLYFVSARSINPIHGDRDYEQVIPRSQVLCALLLNEDVPSPLLPENIRTMMTGETNEDEPAESESDDEAAEEEADADEITPVRIDLEGIAHRVVELPVEAGYYGNLAANDTRLFYMDFPLVGRAAPAPRQPRLWAYDLEKQESEQIVDWLPRYELSGDGSVLAFQRDSEILIADANGPVDWDNLDRRVDVRRLRFRLEPADEWRQIYREAWRLQRDFYWDEGMAGVDWQREYERYEPLLERLSTRQELNDLIGELIGELGTSHANVGGGDGQAPPHLAVGVLGADVEPDEDADAHRFRRVLRAEPWETDVNAPLTQTHAAVREGDYLFAVNDIPLTASDNLYERLAGLAGEQVRLTVGASPDRSDARDIELVTLGGDRTLRYYDWVRRNREYVDEKSGGRIGYMHLPDMSGRGLVAFAKTFYAQLDKQAIVVDIRFNGGGNVSQLLIERFDREIWARMKARRGSPQTYPARTFPGHLALIINHWAGSDGDIFPQSWRIKDLGPIIGTRTWGGVVGIRSDKPFVDGGMSTQPEYAWWAPGIGWDLENSGVAPDLHVEIRPEDYLTGRDPQLDRALMVLERAIADDPISEPPLPPPPDKSLR
jgi:tricorn protease